MPAPQSTLTFDFVAEGLKRKEAEWRAREDRMRNALEILAEAIPLDVAPASQWARFVRATAREGLGRE